MSTKQTWIVTKFGGTSVRNRASWDNIRTIVLRHIKEDRDVLVVCSAPSKVSDHLQQLIEQALCNTYMTGLHTITEIYRALANELEVPFSVIAEDIALLGQLCEGVAKLSEASPKTRARMMSFGELMLTKLGGVFLNQSIPVEWVDARELLIVNPEAGQLNNYLSASYQAQDDPGLRDQFKQLGTHVVLTQGFIGGTTQHETVLFGRGGSDVSAAYFSVKLKAVACEIWTDVPGIYTANPHQVPQARLLQHLDYKEVQEIASLGAKVLHPNCIAPVQAEKIPLLVKNTAAIDHPGTRIDHLGNPIAIPVKAVIMREQVYLVSIESAKMWHEFGFLANIFTCFKKYHVSIDLISTSQTHITVSLDDTLKPDQPEVIHSLLHELSQYGDAKLIGPCASISLVGRQIRAVLPEISNLFEVFIAQKIYLISQAANDLNLTFVVDEDQAPRLVKKLHTMLIEQNPRGESLGKSWAEEYGTQPEQRIPWWQAQQQRLLELAPSQAPAYVYFQPEVAYAVAQLTQCDHIDKIFYAIKANPHPDLLRYLHQQGMRFECVSLGEIEHLNNILPELDPKSILFTPNFAPRDEYASAIQLGVNMNVDNAYIFSIGRNYFKERKFYYGLI
jgi:bifunctional diaminopimelate decarboxylase / aspartate kinase